MVKGLVLRYGGMQMYIKARPWFLGMVLGEFVISGIWLPIDWYFGVRGHVIFPIE